MLEAVGAGVAAMLAAQRARWLLWAPMGAVCGAAWAISAPTPAPVWLSCALFFGGAGLATAIAAWPSTRPGGIVGAFRVIGAGVCVLGAAIGFGVGAAQLRAAMAYEAAFAAPDGPVLIEGWVVADEPSARSPRLRLLVRSIGGVETPPRYVRVSVARAGVLSPGRAAQCRAELAAPNGPLAPGGYDFARRAYFERLSATGFAYGRCRPADLPAPDSVLDRWRLKLAAMRHDMSAAMQSAAPGRGGAIAAAISTGDRSSIDTATNEALRDSGLGHLLSVSGVHMAVVGGLVFGALRWAFALVPFIALRWPVKKLAAIGALAALAGYLVISGSSVPAVRAFIMAAVAFGAIVIDRPAISMRGLALAALVIVGMYPESVLEPGFQMSFAATMALVALFEVLKKAPDGPRAPIPGPVIGTLNWVVRGTGGVIGVSMAAGLATDPFAIYHFQRFATFALAANLAAAPIMTFIVAPAAGAAAVLAPFGLAAPALQVMASGLDLVAAIGDAFGQRPDAVRALPKPPDAAMLACVLAMVWGCLWRGQLRWFGLAPLAAAIGLYVTAPRPAIAFDGAARAVFARIEGQGGAHWALMERRQRSNYARERLGAMLGLAPVALERLAAPDGCGEGLCLWTTPGGRAGALVHTEAGFAHACMRADIVISELPAPGDFAARCGASALIDGRALAHAGGALIYETPQGLRIERAVPADARRAWIRRTSKDAAGGDAAGAEANPANDEIGAYE